MLTCIAPIYALQALVAQPPAGTLTRSFTGAAFWDGVLWATKTFDNEGRFWHNLECHSSHSQPFRFVLGGGGRKPEIWTPFAPDKDLMAFLNR